MPYLLRLLHRDAVLRRMKLDDEELERPESGGSWQRCARSKRCDCYRLPGLNLFCHDERLFRFSSRPRSEPLREHINMGEYVVCSPPVAPPNITAMPY